MEQIISFLAERDFELVMNNGCLYSFANKEFNKNRIIMNVQYKYIGFRGNIDLELAELSQLVKLLKQVKE